MHLPWETTSYIRERERDMSSEIMGVLRARYCAGHVLILELGYFYPAFEQSMDSFTYSI